MTEPEPSFKSDLKFGGNRFLVKLEGVIAEDTEVITKCVELQELFKKKIKGDKYD